MKAAIKEVIEAETDILSDDAIAALLKQRGFDCARRGRVTGHREEHFGAIGRGATRIECMRVAVEMMTEML